MSLVTFGGVSCVRAAAYLPSWGLWWAECETSSDTEFSGQVPLVMGGEALLGTVVAGGVKEGRGRWRIVAGRGKLGGNIPARNYSNDAGVRVSLIAAEIASATGEIINVGSSGSRSLGPGYTVAGDPAYVVLNSVAPQAWYADELGIIQIGARQQSNYSGSGTVLSHDAESRRVNVAATELSGLVPGVRIDGAEPATDVEWILDENRLHARVSYSTTPLTRSLIAFAKIFNALDPDRKFRGVYEYRVVAQQGSRLTLQPVRSGTSMPVLQRVPIRAGIPGAKFTLLPGATVLVQFLDGDRGRPCVTGFDADDQPGWTPISLQFGGPVALGIAYQGSTVQAGPFAGLVTLGSTTIKVTP